jgi:ribosomal protein S18 acetylase RimI-like enzyme
MANALNRHEGLHPNRFTPAIVRRDAFGPRRAFRVLVAEAERGPVVGYAAFVPGYNTDIAARDMWMLDLFVQPAWRSRGVGRALVTAVAREAVRRGLPSLEWGVRSSNTRALRFYRRLGARVGQARIASLQDPALAALASDRR